MKHREYFVISEKMKIRVVQYLILEFMHYNQKGLDIFNPAISYLGISRNLYNFHMKGLMKLDFIKVVGKNYELTSKCINRLDSYIKNKDFFAETFEEFWKIYPNNSAKKGAKNKWFLLTLTDELFKEIMDGTKRQILEREQLLKKDPKKFIPEWSMGQTYIFNERWNDSLIPKSTFHAKAEVKTTYKKEKL